MQKPNDGLVKSEVREMGKEFYKINDFIDIGSAKVGDSLGFFDNDGQWRQTDKIIRAQVAGNKVLVETQNCIYTNYDYVQEYDVKSLEMKLAERCVDENKHAKCITRFNGPIECLCSDGQYHPIATEDIRPGYNLHINCEMMDMETGKMRRGVLSVPNVQDIDCEGNAIVIESRSTIFSNVDFSKELDEIKMEREQEIGRDWD